MASEIKDLEKDQQELEDWKTLKEYRLKADIHTDPDGVTYVTHSFGDEWELPALFRRTEKWKRVERVGKGAYGSVWLEVLVEGDTPGPTKRAVKKIKKEKIGKDSKELKAMAAFSKRTIELSISPFPFVKFHGWFEDKKRLYIAMDYIGKGTLREYIKEDNPIPEYQIKEITRQILVGLVVMHAKEFTHRDLKPDNIFIQSPGPNWLVKIGDFGISKQVEGDNTAWRTVTGTDRYKAPEVDGSLPLINGQEYDRYSKKVDMWSLGCVVFEMAATKQVFSSETWRIDYYDLCQKRWYPNQPANLSDEGWAFVRKLLAAQPADRLSAIEALGHEWIQTREPLPKEAVNGLLPPATDTPRQNDPKLENEHSDHNITPFKLNTSSEIKPDYPKDINTTSRAQGMERPPSNMTSASGLRTLTTRSKQKWEDAHPPSHPGDGHDNDTTGKFSTDRSQVMPSSSDGTKPSPDSPHRTVVKKASGSDPHTNVTAEGTYQRTPAPFVTMVTGPSGLIPATKKHNQVAQDQKAWSKIIKSRMEEVRQPTVSAEDTDPSHHGQDYYGEDYGEAFETLYKEQPEDRAARKKQVTFATPTTTKKEDGHSTVSDEVTESMQNAQDYCAEDYVDAFNTLFAEHPENRARLEEQVKIDNSLTSREEGGQSMVSDDDPAWNSYVNSYYGEDYGDAFNTLYAEKPRERAAPVQIPRFEKPRLNPKEVSTVGKPVEKPVKRPGVNVDAVDSREFDYSPSYLLAERPMAGSASQHQQESHKPPRKSAGATASFTESKHPSITIQVADASDHAQASMDLFSELPMAERNAPQRRSRKKNKNVNKSGKNISEDTNSIYQAELLPHLLPDAPSSNDSPATSVNGNIQTSGGRGYIGGTIRIPDGASSNWPAGEFISVLKQQDPAALDAIERSLGYREKNRRSAVTAPAIAVKIEPQKPSAVRKQGKPKRRREKKSNRWGWLSRGSDDEEDDDDEDEDY